MRHLRMKHLAYHDAAGAVDLAALVGKSQPNDCASLHWTIDDQARAAAPNVEQLTL
jgi:hypothetical protein